MTLMSPSILGHVPISILKLNASFYLYNMSSKDFCSVSVKHVLSKFTILFLKFLYLTYSFFQHLCLAINMDHPILVFLS